MKKFGLPVLLFVFWALASSALPQKNMSPPPPPLDPDRKVASEEATLSRHVDVLQLQKEADILARTAQTIPADVANVRQGRLPKDVIEKLKQIEKLSKHLRSELNP